jgi:superfamily I DNA and/or RNA helicase
LDFYRSQIGAPHYELLRVLFGLRQPMDQRNKELVKVDPWFDNSLNEWQKLAVQRSLTADYYSLIHGPPGTGKTKTVCEVIQQLCHRKQKVLVTGASNIAVDNIIERLEKLKSPFKIIRIGNPTRTLE